MSIISTRWLARHLNQYGGSGGSPALTERTKLVARHQPRPLPRRIACMHGARREWVRPLACLPLPARRRHLLWLPLPLPAQRGRTEGRYVTPAKGPPPPFTPPRPVPSRPVPSPQARSAGAAPAAARAPPLTSHIGHGGRSGNSSAGDRTGYSVRSIQKKTPPVTSPRHDSRTSFLSPLFSTPTFSPSFATTASTADSERAELHG
jgi:hypothetical protein